MYGFCDITMYRSNISVFAVFATPVSPEALARGFPWDQGTKFGVKKIRVLGLYPVVKAA